MSAADLWTATVLRYPDADLLTLVKRLAGGTSEDLSTYTAAGEVVAADLIALDFPREVQDDYDPTDAAHVSLASGGVVALMRKRGGSAKSSTKPSWEEWLADCETFRNTIGARTRVPVERGGKEYMQNGEEVPKWSSRRNYRWQMPDRRGDRPANSDAGSTYGGP